MLLKKENIITIAKSYLPQDDSATLERIASEVKQDAEPIIHTMVRQAAAQERENLYRQQEKMD